jgi:hypothetical protein
MRTATNPKAAGKLLEPAVLQWAELQIGKLTRNQYRSAKDQGLPIGCNIDGILFETGDPVEAKTSGLYGNTNDVYGEPNTDQVPDHVIIQSHGHMIATGKDRLLRAGVCRLSRLLDVPGAERCGYHRRYLASEASERFGKRTFLPIFHPTISCRIRRS